MVTQRVGWILAVGALYLAAARLCLELPVRDGALTALWLPSGVALAALLLGGRWMLVGVFVGDVVTSLMSGFSWTMSVGFAIGDSAEALLAATLLLRVTPGVIEHVRHVWILVPIIAMASSVSATVGTLLLSVDGSLDGERTSSWLLYWSSTATAMVLVGPVVLAWRRRDEVARAFLRQSHPARVAVEAALLVATLVYVGTQVFLVTRWELLGLFLLFPLLTWATVRFGQYGATMTVLVVAMFGVWGSARETLDITGMSNAMVVQTLQLMLAVVLLANLVLAVVLAERDRARGGLEELLSVFGHALQLAHVGSWQLRLRPRSDQQERAPEQAPGADILPSASADEVMVALGAAHADEARLDVWYSSELSTILGLGDNGRASTKSLHAMLDLVAADDRARLVRAVRDAIVVGGVYSLEHGVRRAHDGSRRVVRHVGTVVDRDDPDGGRIIGSVLDVTDQRDIELLKDSLIATASHELRTPLTSVLGFVSILGRSWDDIPDHDRRRYLRHIEEQSRRLAVIIEDTLELARLDQRTAHAAIERVNVADVIEQALESIPNAEQVEVDSTCDVNVAADPDHLSRIITNLVTNAQKYGAPPIELSCGRLDASRNHADGAVCLRVVDHGTGVIPAFEPRMWDRFARGPDTVHATGTGLGLSIVRELVELMQGTVNYAHHDDTTTFEVVLPAAAARAGAAVSVGSTGERA